MKRCLNRYNVLFNHDSTNAMATDIGWISRFA